MKRHLVLAAAALFVLAAFPASAQLYWALPGSAGTVDESASGLYEFTNATLKFKSGYVYYIEVTLTRSTTTPNPQFHAAQLLP